jgi:N-acetylmuramoyl-L-alanine amidase
MGFPCGAENGHLGPVTDRAIRQFQKDFGIRSDGVCGPKMFRALDQLQRSWGHESAQAVKDRASLGNIRTGIRGKVIVLDPDQTGKGWQDGAAICTSLASRIEGKLAPRDATVMLTQPVGQQTTPQSDDASRAEFCNEVDADLVLSIVVASDPEAPSGISTYYYGRSSRALSLPGQLAASLVLDTVTSRTDMPDGGDHGRTWDLLRLTRMPAVRIQIGNAAFEADRKRLEAPEFAEALASAIADSVVRFFAPPSTS